MQRRTWVAQGGETRAWCGAPQPAPGEPIQWPVMWWAQVPSRVPATASPSLCSAALGLYQPGFARISQTELSALTLLPRFLLGACSLGDHSGTSALPCTAWCSYVPHMPRAWQKAFGQAGNLRLWDIAFLKLLDKQDPFSDPANGNVNGLQWCNVFFTIKMDTAALFSPWLVVICPFYEAFLGFLATGTTSLLTLLFFPCCGKKTPES